VGLCQHHRGVRVDTHLVRHASHVSPGDPRPDPVGGGQLVQGHSGGRRGRSERPVQRAPVGVRATAEPVEDPPERRVDQLAAHGGVGSLSDTGELRDDL
jgi:hypothetical protein